MPAALGKAAACAACAFALWKVYRFWRAYGSDAHALQSLAHKEQPDAAHHAEFFANKDGLWIYTRQWVPASKPRAAVFISHGFGEHCGRYDHVARALVERGVAVFSMDHQGHGRSHGDRAYVRDFCTDYVEDFLAMTDRAAQQLPADCPRFVFGHSMGGAVALLVALARPAFWSGVVLSAPVLQADPKVATPMMRSLSRLFSRWLPKLPLKKLPANSISRSPAIVYSYEHDPLTYRGKLGPMRARWGQGAMQAMDKIKGLAHTLRLPLLVMQGTADSLVHPEGARWLYENAQSEVKLLRMYDSLYHEVLNEPEWRSVLDDMLQWLEARLEAM